jgi:FtsH-binding integral membrane protein
MNVDQQARKFIMQSIRLMLLLNVIGSIAIAVWNLSLTVALMVSTAFVLAVDVASTLIWRKVMLAHPNMLPTFYTSVSGFRFLLALVVMTVWFVATGRESMMTFFIVFLVFYMVSLAHHSIYFSRISNRS